MTGHGFPDDEFAGIPFGSTLKTGQNVNTAAGVDLLGGTALPLAAYQGVQLHAKTAAGGSVDAEWQLDDAPAGVTVHNTGTLTPDVNGTAQAFLLALGHTLVSLTVTADTIDYALAGASNRPLPRAPGTDYLTVGAGMYTVFWPQDVHAPQSAAGEPSPVRKAVIKVAVEQ